MPKEDFQAGHKKGGRPKGRLNNKTLATVHFLQGNIEKFGDKLKRYNIDPFKFISEDLPLLDPFERCQVMLALLKFQYPTIKPIEAKKQDNPFSNLPTQELIKHMKEGLQFLEQAEAEGEEPKAKPLIEVEPKPKE